MKKSFLKIHRIPVFDSQVWFGVGPISQMGNQRRKLDWALGPVPEDYTVYGGCVWRCNSNRFLIQICRESICHEIIAHEIFHLAHRIMEFIEQPITESTHESHARLVGYLTEKIYVDLHNWKIKIPLKAKVSPSRPPKKR